MKKLGIAKDTFPSDLVAGTVNAVTSIPDALGSAVLAGLDPIHGLYAIMVGTPVGALTTGSVFMNVSITGAMALAVGDALVGYSGEELAEALIVLTILVGITALTLGILKLGTLTRFVSNAVMTGFLTGIAVLILLGQLGDLTGTESEFSNDVVAALDLLLHPAEINLPTLVIGLLTIAVILLLDRSPARNFSMVIAIFIGSVVAYILGLDSVELVGDISEIPRSIPMPRLPDLSLVRELFGAAVAIAIIALVQGAGVGRNYPNPDGTYPDASKDFSGQGIANIASGIFQGMPVGGSLSSTAINVSTGARTRWANIMAGIIALVLVLLFAGLIELVAMPCVAALLIVAGWQAINFGEIVDVRDTGWMPRLIMVVTFVMTLTLPIQQAVFAGVVLSLLLFIYQEAMTVRIMELVAQPDGSFLEKEAPGELPNQRVTVLHLYGTTFFGAAYTLEKQLPSALHSKKAVVILRLRGHDGVASTFIGVLERYVAQLQAGGGRLMLSGVYSDVWERLLATETTESIPRENIFLEQDILGASTHKAMQAAHRLLAGTTEEQQK
ncbi:SulP family inorganic anion transporter [Chloroflexota bacterium]